MGPVNALKRWRDLEPVRLYLYGVLTAGLLLAVSLAYLTTEEALAWAAFGAAVLGVPAVEVARSKVSPVGVRSPHKEPRPAWGESTPAGRGLDVIVDTPPVPMTDSGPPRDYVD